MRGHVSRTVTQRGARMAKKKESVQKRTERKQGRAVAATKARRSGTGGGSSGPKRPAASVRGPAEVKRTNKPHRQGIQGSLRTAGGPPGGTTLLRPPRLDLPSPTPPRASPRPGPLATAAAEHVQPVTEADYPEFRRLLVAERERLLQELATLGERLQQVEEIGLVEAANEDDYGDVASEAFEREKGFALETSVQGMLRMVEEALRKLDAGTYGTCERCGGPIGVERLRALPFANLCIRCKAEQERESGAGNGWSS